MPTEPSDVGTLADAVAVGRPVDWQAAEHLADTAEVCRIVRELSVLATLANVYRADVEEAGTHLPITRWGRFESMTAIGSGANATVYRCWDPVLERSVALKLLHANAADGVTLAEARLLAKVRHPNIVTIHGVDRVDGRLGLWMEHLSGRTLKDEVIEGGPLSPRDAAHVASDLCRGLAAVHAAGLIHGDIKAQNVIREADGRIVLMDFGAGVNPDASANDRYLSVAGSPAYMAPERFEGGAATVRADVYSVGVLLFYLVTKQFPFDARSIDELVVAHRSGRRRLTALRPDVPAAFVSVVDCALAPRPEDRYAGPAEMLAALQGTLLAMGDVDQHERLSRHRLRMLAGVVAVVVGFSLAVRWARDTGVSAPLVESIAVLPFANLSGNADEDYLADGVTDMLTSDLAQLNSLRVTSRTSVLRYAHTREAIPTIGRALHVDALVEGAVTHANGRVRITAQVIRTSTDTHVWSEIFERKDDDLFALQALMASSIADAIKVVVTPTEHQRVATPHPVKASAQDAYLRGRYLMDQFTADSERQAVELLKRAVTLDASYARAYASLARSYILLDFFGVLPRRDAYELAYEAAMRAVALDDTLADAHGELADILLYHKWDWVAAEREYRRSIELNRSNTLARSHYSRYLSAIGNHREALEHARLTLDGDPFSVEALNSPPIALYYADRFGEAVAGYRNTLRLFPNSAETHFGLGRALAGVGEYASAAREIGEALRLSQASIFYRAELARTTILGGQRREGLALLAEAQGNRGAAVSAQYLGYIYAALGDSNKAFDYLNQAVRERSPGLLWAKVDPRLASLRHDPRFPPLLRALGVPE